MLAMLNQRLSNDPATEITIAAAEQAKITELRTAGTVTLRDNLGSRFDSLTTGDLKLF